MFETNHRASFTGIASNFEQLVIVVGTTMSSSAQPFQHGPEHHLQDDIHLAGCRNAHVRSFTLKPRYLTTIATLAACGGAKPYSIDCSPQESNLYHTRAPLKATANWVKSFAEDIVVTPDCASFP